ncbi:2Fe-2S iron-sulfur cluster-binding protein [Nocardioides houyundeii]|uniref:2Fe-2S iron-sulfur cluster-binding protein n=1 Tax=Nocardioides houyundeii TaxID=2045452 RepID=UPI000C78D69B|nr:2Fe-2S iron-sulfur cluster-binding protein [Nocardioides houyundeii]
MARPQASVHPLTVARVDPLTDEAVAITFEVPDDLPGDYAFVAGQHLTILGPDDVRRSFSLCCAPSSGTLRIGVKRLPGGVFSDQVVSTLRPGDVLEVMTPAGRFVAEPDPSRKASYVAIAAGSGITPVLSIVTALLEGEPGSTVTLLCANRTAASVMFLDEVHDLKDAHPTRLQVLHVLSREARDATLLSGRLDAARLAQLLAAFVDSAAVDDWFLCGPQPMMTELRALLVARGTGRVHVELFHATAPSGEPARGGRLAQVATPDGSARVVAHLDGRASEIDLRPDGPTVLDAMATVRGDLPFACKGGVCGTCRAKVVQGTVAMDLNYALEPDEVAGGYVLTCQSHPTATRVVLDYDA